jgi:hypothetical protein
MTRWHCHQHDSAFTSRRGQVAPAAPSLASLDCIVASMTWHLHRATAKSPQQHRRQHDSAALSPAWLGIYITLWPSHSGSAIVRMTRHLHRITAKSSWQHRCQHDSTALMLAWLIIYITSWSNCLSSSIASSTWQHCYQHDSTSISHNSLIININKIRLQRQADMLSAHTSTICHYVWF